MRKIRWQILIVTLALIAIGVLLLGQQPNLQPIVPEVQPTTGGIYTEGLIGSLWRLNPILDYRNSVDRDIDRLIYSSLLRFDARGLPQNELVESMGISQDGTIYNFSLRADAIWHDGKPLTSEDVIFTIELMRDDNLPVPEDIRALWKAVDVQVLDEHVLQFRLPEPYAPFLDYLTFGILPKHLLEGLSPEELVDAQFNIEPVGSGPYRFERLLVENGEIKGVILTKFEEYFAEPPFIEQLVFRYYPDAPSALAAYRSGEVAGISQITPEILPDALKEPNLRLYTGRLPQLTLIFLNLDNPEVPFFQESDVRRALLMALNRQRMIDTLQEGQAFIADGPVFPGTWAYYEGIERVNYDLDAAIALLIKAGYTIPAEGGNVRAKEDVRLTFDLVFPDNPQFAALADMIARDWSRAGVLVNLKAVSYEELLDNYLTPRDYHAALVSLDLARSPDPDPYPFWHQTQVTGGQNYSKWDDRQASEYLEQARLTTDLAERARLYRNFQVRFTSEMPALPLFYPVYTYGVDAQVLGVTMGPLFDTSDRFATITEWFLVARRTLETTTSPQGNTASSEGGAPSATP